MQASGHVRRKLMKLIIEDGPDTLHSALGNPQIENLNA
ncbi:MAG: hypothetical protein K0R64_3337 [Novosphingobium lindaniclasticum]|jgi:hypothetical protein|nr:hypothetical protein [Novosphingobium lindaniclasticum]